MQFHLLTGVVIEQFFAIVSIASEIGFHKSVHLKERVESDDL